MDASVRRSSVVLAFAMKAAVKRSDEKFVSWGVSSGMPVAVLRDLAKFAATRKEMRRSIDEMLPPPPIYPVSDIQEMHEDDPMGIEPGRAGFLIVGTCPNGDPIAVDIRDEPGTVWYLSHEQMFGKDAEGLRSVAVKVASGIPAFWQRRAEDKSFPLNYWDAS